MQELTLKAPASVPDVPPKRLSFEVGRRPPISPEKLTELERQVKLTLEESRANTAVLRRRLNALNDVLEGVMQEVNYPFPQASNVDVKMAVGTARTLRSTMARALFSDPDRVFVASIEDEAMRSDSNIVEDAFNWKSAHDNGLIDALKDSIIPIFRDGTAFIQGVWERRVERVMDYKTYLTGEEFTMDYPDPESAGLSEEKYLDVLTHLAAPDTDVEICFERDLVKKDDASFSVVTLPRFYWWPLSAKSIEDCELYGVRMEESEATMRRKAKNGEYRKYVVETCLNATKEGAPVLDVWDRSRDFIEGISRSNASKRKDFENFRIVLTVDLDDDDIPEKYMGVFNLAQGKFLNFDRYKIRNNIDFLVPVGFDRRDDRLLRRSLLYDGMDLYQQITDIHRHRNNARLITDAPGFKADENMKDKIEGDLQNWRPGVVIWVPGGKMDSVQQLAVQNRSNTQNSIDEENLLTRYVEFVVGPTQGLSGQESKEDPNAPATKHLSKIRQAGFRMDDYLDEFKRSFPAVGRLALALYYQYGPREIAYQAADDMGNMKRQMADRALFGAEGMNIDLNARSVIMSPEFEMERVMALKQGLTPGVVMLNPMIEPMLWNRYVAASRAQNPEELKVQIPPAVPGMPPGMPMMPGAPGMPGMPGAGAPTPAGPGTPPLEALVASLGNNGASRRVEQVAR